MDIYMCVCVCFVSLNFLWSNLKKFTRSYQKAHDT